MFYDLIKSRTLFLPIAYKDYIYYIDQIKLSFNINETIKYITSQHMQTTVVFLRYEQNKK